MKIFIPDKVSKTSAKMLDEAGFQTEQIPGIEVGNIPNDADALIVRSYKLHSLDFNDNLKAIGRAGAGVDNIPVDKCTEKGIVVFNTPGANANAVKELVLCSMLLASRRIIDGVNWTMGQKDKGDKVPELVEKNKNQFGGIEVKGKSLGVVGLGAIGALVANDALSLGMNVIGYDPYISVDNAWKISKDVNKAKDLNSLLANSDYVTLHIPLTNQTKGVINKNAISRMKNGIKLINFSRNEIVNTEDLKQAIKDGKISKYITDFPSHELLGVDNVVCVPHLGASTEEAEENSAIAVSGQMIDFLKNGNIANSVNFPACELERNGGARLAIVNRNIPGMIEKITEVLAEKKLNIMEMINKSRGDIAYNILDVNRELKDGTIEQLQNIEGVIKVRRL